MNTQFASEQEKLLHDIGVLSFVVIELSLYLDTHPTDQNALQPSGKSGKTGVLRQIYAPHNFLCGCFGM